MARSDSPTPWHSVGLEAFAGVLIHLIKKMRQVPQSGALCSQQRCSRVSGHARRRTRALVLSGEDQAKFSGACECLKKERHVLLTVYGFPAKPWGSRVEDQPDRIDVREHSAAAPPRRGAAPEAHLRYR